MHRRHFVTLAAAAAFAPCVARKSALAQPVDLQAPLRVRLFAGLDIVRLSAGGVQIDAAAGTLSTAHASQTLGSQIVELSASPLLDVSALTTTGSTIERRYPGTLFIQLQNGMLHVINRVDAETYVASVLASEVSPSWPAESLRAQAIAVRTYAAHARNLSTRDYDLNDDTTSQVYRGLDGITSSLVSAANDTSGQVLTAGGLPATIYYSSSCGGHTASSFEITGLPPPPYLLGVLDADPSGRPDCASAPYFRWMNSVSAEAMSRIVNVPADRLDGVAITERWPDGRVKTITVSGAGATTTFEGRTFYSRALSVLGYKVIPSALFDVSRNTAGFDFIGHGVGHGVGMCQWGARGRADAGMQAAQILAAYFPSTVIARMQPL
ncbi:MAG: SpoIID/LytB domain-containing protein [Candidatus Eremiobacteraeota bacterium]|nr:SpoIID/LytB domain-containing protein [Candidatus Eremiobacteraeota bacterium]